METLLEKAKSKDLGRPREGISEEHIELALAWMKNELSLAQVTYALGYKTSSNAYLKLAVALREAYKNKEITIKYE